MSDSAKEEISTSSAGPISKRNILFASGIIILIGLAIFRSAMTTSLDGFTYDEAYHIGAGVAYVKTRDFRLNPEHPPLVKLWVGAYLSLFEYQISPYRKLSDKFDERQFVENDVFNNNDHLVIQSRVRAAMFALNGLLLFVFGLAVWRVFGDVFALGATAFLAIDPTVAAHLPVVMTDLPVALTSATAVILAVAAFRSWAILDLVLAAIALGVALATKHSAVITFITVALIGIVKFVVHALETESREPFDAWRQLPPSDSERSYCCGPSTGLGFTRAPLRRKISSTGRSLKRSVT